MSLLDGTRLVVLDTETTGFDPGGGHALVEVAAVTLDSGQVSDAWSSLVRPGRPIPPDASRVHGITDSLVAWAPAPAAVAKALRQRCDELPLVFHNADFDLPFVIAALRDAGEPPLMNLVLDVLGLARGIYGVGGNRLEKLAAKLGIEAQATHRALPDALTTAKVFVELVGIYERDRGVKSLGELAAISRDVMRATRHS
jgi:DNA polymerase-3 subunit epsilon